MSATTPVTQRDVANACGLHPSTVCLALKNSPSIPLQTRQRIRAIAEELGYTPNVAARNLALLRTEKKPGALLPLAWINQERQRDHWRSNREARIYFDAARHRAEELGYHLEEIWTLEPGMTATRIIQILRARGIDGVLFPVHYSFDFALLNRAWNDFSMVGFNDHRLGEWLDVVCPDYYRNTDVALVRLRQLGFTSPGLILSPQSDAATNGLVRSCFLRHQADFTDGSRVPVCLTASDNDAALSTVASWFREHRPDVVLCHGVRSAGGLCDVLDEVPWVDLHGELEQGAAGVDACGGDVASAAVECVVEKIRRFEKGCRESTRVHTIKGTWHDGQLDVARELEPVVA